MDILGCNVLFLLRWFAIPVVLLFAAGCAITKEVYLQDAQITSPIQHPPIHMAQGLQKGRVIITPSFSLGPSSVIDGTAMAHSPVDGQGIFGVDTITTTRGNTGLTPGKNPYVFSGSNVHWKLVPLTAGLAIDYSAGAHVAFSGGFNYSSNAAYSLWGGFVGLGVMTEGKSLGLRLDGGVQWVSTSCEAWSAVVTEETPLFSRSTESLVAFYHDTQRRALPGWYLGFTLNTVNPDWIMHGFVRILVSHQKLLSLGPTEVDPLTGPFEDVARSIVPDDIEASADMLCISPGIAIPIGASQYLQLGAHASFVHGLSNVASGLVVIPFVQVDFTL